MTIDSGKYTKADMLHWLQTRVSHSRIEDLLIFTVRDWVSNELAVCQRIQDKFNSSSPIVIRSSSLCEDGLTESHAGCYRSMLDVCVSESAIRDAVKLVIGSYGDVHSSSFGDNQILVQRQTQKIIASGVVFTRQIETNAPYYVINYDDKTGLSNTVTGGIAGKSVFISHYWPASECGKWGRLIKAVREVESFFKGVILDIEFAITEKDEVVIFQVRPLAANHEVPIPEDAFVKRLIEDMVRKHRNLTQRVPHLGGASTILGDMPDWNPSEIIGSKPNTLDYTIYGFMVTDEVWHLARSSIGYYDVYPAELMVSFGKKPYIDTRASFNSLTPATISSALREKLVNYYHEKLKKHPEYQDKVEFEILWTCYDFKTRDGAKELLKFGFTEEEVSIFVESLHGLTDKIINNYKIITNDDLNQIKHLSERREALLRFYERGEKTPWAALSASYHILQNCKRFGTFPFSRQARLAFIAKAFLISMKHVGVLTEELYQGFLSSIRTVASQFNDDFYQLHCGLMNKEAFSERYGHLRAGTYDITASRYDKLLHLFANNGTEQLSIRENGSSFLPQNCLDEIGKLLKAHKMSGDGSSIIGFVKSAVENREYAKFEFTKSLSSALELIASAGEMLGFSREELCHADLPTIMKFRNPEHGDVGHAKVVIRQSIERHKKEREWYNSVILPPIISSEEDFYSISHYVAMPNFITQKFVRGEVANFDEIRDGDVAVLSNKIVLLENADPGYDWIFTKKPLGIVTKYGGVASHMSIRCAEFGTSAAIGCGEIIYERVRKAKHVILDCEKKIIKPVFHYED